MSVKKKKTSIIGRQNPSKPSLIPQHKRRRDHTQGDVKTLQPSMSKVSISKSKSPNILMKSRRFQKEKSTLCRSTPKLMHLKNLLTDKKDECRGVRKKRLFKKAHYTQSIYTDLEINKKDTLAESPFSPGILGASKPSFNFTKQKKPKRKMQLVGGKVKKLRTKKSPVPKKMDKKVKTRINKPDNYFSAHNPSLNPSNRSSKSTKSKTKSKKDGLSSKNISSIFSKRVPLFSNKSISGSEPSDFLTRSSKNSKRRTGTGTSKKDSLKPVQEDWSKTSTANKIEVAAYKPQPPLGRRMKNRSIHVVNSTQEVVGSEKNESNLKELGGEGYSMLGPKSKAGPMAGDTRVKKEEKNSISLRNTGGKEKAKRRKKVRKASLEIILKGRDGLKNQYEWPELEDYTSERRKKSSFFEGKVMTWEDKGQQTQNQEDEVQKNFEKEGQTPNQTIDSFGDNHNLTTAQNEQSFEDTTPQTEPENRNLENNKQNIFERSDRDETDLGIDRKVFDTEDSEGQKKKLIMASRLTLGDVSSQDRLEIKLCPTPQTLTAKFSIDEYGKNEQPPHENQEQSRHEKQLRPNWNFPLTPRLVSSTRKKINFTSPSPGKTRLKLAHSDIHKPIRDDLHSSKLSRPRKKTLNLMKTAPLQTKKMIPRISQKRRIDQKRIIMQNLTRMRSPTEKSKTMGLHKMEKYFKTVSVSNLNRVKTFQVKREFSSMKQTPKVDLKEFVNTGWGEVRSKKRSIKKIQIIQKPRGFMRGGSQYSSEKSNQKLHNSLHFHDSKKHTNKSRFKTVACGDTDDMEWNSDQAAKDSAVEPLFEYGRSKSFRTGEDSGAVAPDHNQNQKEKSELADWANVKSQFDHRSFGRSLSKKDSSVDNIFSKSRERTGKYESGIRNKMKKKSKQNRPMAKFEAFQGKLERTASKKEQRSAEKLFVVKKEPFFEYQERSQDEEATQIKKEAKNVFFMDPLGADTQGSNTHEKKNKLTSNITSLGGKAEEPVFLEGLNSFRNIGLLEKRKVTDGITLFSLF